MNMGMLMQLADKENQHYRQELLNDHKERVNNRIKANEESIHRRQLNLDNKINPFRSAVFSLGLEPENAQVIDFINFLSCTQIYNHKYVFDVLRCGYELIIKSNKVSIENKNTAKLALLRVGVFIK